MELNKSKPEKNRLGLKSLMKEKPPLCRDNPLFPSFFAYVLQFPFSMARGRSITCSVCVYSVCVHVYIYFE